VTSKAVTTLTRLAAIWREGLVVIQDDRLHARARAGGWLLEADAAKTAATAFGVVGFVKIVRGEEHGAAAVPQRPEQRP
jgi:hypothetical protein